MSLKTSHPRTKCALCLQEIVLIQSHIVPRWYWKTLKTEGKYYTVSGTDGSHQMGQDDLTEPLMCKKCDRSFSNLENSFRYWVNKWLEHPFPHPQLQIPLQDYVEFSYSKAKLFAWLLAWRMSLSTLSLFKEVQLPRDAMEDLRLRLLSGDAGTWHQYPVYIERETCGLFKGAMAAPRMRENPDSANAIFHWFVAGAWVTIVFPLTGTGIVSAWDRVSPSELRKLPGFIKENGRVSLPHRSITTDESLHGLYSEESGQRLRSYLARKNRSGKQAEAI